MYKILITKKENKMTNWEKHEAAFKELYEDNGHNLTPAVVMGYLYEQGMLGSKVIPLNDEDSIRPIRFYCTRCGKELFELVDYKQVANDTIEETINNCLCSDCLLNDLKIISSIVSSVP